MAKPRRKQPYTPALLENLRFRFEQTDESVVDIAASIPRSHTTLRKLARELGWTKFVPPPLDLSPAAKLAAEAGRLAAEAGRPAAEAARKSALSSRATECNEDDPGPIRRSDHEASGLVGPRLRGDDREETACAPQDEEEAAGALADLSNLAPDARLARLSEMARVVDFQLAVLRQKQAHPQRGEDTKAINADVKNFAATSALIEHQLRDLQSGRSTPLPNETNDDIPEDIDAFRLRLAAKIEAFLDRRPDIGDDDADADRRRGPDRA